MSSKMIVIKKNPSALKSDLDESAKPTEFNANKLGKSAGLGELGIKLLKLYSQGIHTVPVPYGTKTCYLEDWPNLRIAPDQFDQYYKIQCNVAVLTGKASGNLMDVDCDSEDCRPFLPWLPDTEMTSGHAGNPGSHYFYNVDVDHPTIQYKDDEGAVVIEIRGNGSQTLIPPSQHPDGHIYQWTDSNSPGTAKYADLRDVVARIAAAALIKRKWIPGARHQLAMSLAGAMLRHSWEPNDAIDFIRAIAIAAGDTEVEDRINCVATTAPKLAEGTPTTGLPTLEEHLGPKATKLIIEWLGFDDYQRQRTHQQIIQALNQHLALLVFGGQTFILKEYIDHNGRDDIQLMKTGDLRTLHANDRVIVTNLLGKSRDVTIIDAWLMHRQRRTYQGIVFAPQGAESHFYNLFKGFAVKPAKGDCGLYLEHIKNNICRGNPKNYEYLLNWMAHLIQRPHELPGVAIVLRGQQGTGKGVMVEEFGRLIEPHYIALTSMEQLVGRFTGHLKDRLLVYANEAMWGGNKSAEGALKAMITDENSSVEQKFKDTVRIQNVKRIIFSSNEDWAAPVAKDDRRFLVLDVSSDHKEDIAYFAAIIGQMRKGGSEALMFELLNRDISGFEVRNLPQTPYSFDLKLLSMDTVDQFIFEYLRDATEETWEDTPRKSIFHGEYIEWCQQHGKKHRHPASIFGKHIKQLIPTLKETKKAASGHELNLDPVGKVPKRYSHYVFPSLSESRAHYEKACKATPEIWEL
jgi:hypothetical protein